MNYATLRQRLGRRRGFDGNDARLGDFVNDAYMALCGRRKTWSWLRRAQQLHVHSPQTSTCDVVNGSKSVVSLPSATQTRSGAKIVFADNASYRIARTGAGFGSGGGGTNFTLYLEAGYNGATATGVAFTTHYDEYALPLEASSVESVFITTGDIAAVHGRVVARPRSFSGELSLLPPHMHKMPIVDHESHPQFYSIIRSSQLPTPDAPIIISNALTTATGVLAFNGSTVLDSRYKYRIAFQNMSTYEIGPWSEPSEEVLARGGSSVSLMFRAHGDFRTLFYRTRGLDVGDSFDTATYYLQGVTVLPASVNPTHVDGDSVTGAETPDIALGNQYGHFDVDPYVAGRALDTSTSSRIRLWPPPDDDYTLDVLYHMTPQELSRDSDTPLVPRAHHSIILDLAESFALGEEENHGAAAQKRAYAMESIDRMEREDEIDHPTVIQIGRDMQDVYRGLSWDGWPRNVTG